MIKKYGEPYPTDGENEFPRINSTGQPTQETHTQIADNKQTVQEEPTKTPKQDNAIPDQPSTGPAESAMREIHFHDPDEQHWLELEKQEIERMGHITPIQRDGYTLPGDPNTLIYPERRGLDHWAEQVAIKWFDEVPTNNNTPH